mgnify:CR=1 FL=1|tara:strand:+ start:329 stop:913 length:585 start_codon:yes stop_codon:yes gene_type:complete
MNAIVNILTKNPDSPNCKTRLKGLLTDDERMFLSREMLKITCSELAEVDAYKLLHVYPDYNSDFMKNLLKSFKMTAVLQSKGLLSDKIYSALDYLKASYTKRIVIGSDIPSISRYDISQSISYLDNYDLVIGPSDDGGFYLIGIKRFGHQFFKFMKQNKILNSDIIKICIDQNINYKLLRTLKDIDEPKDLLCI